MPFPYLSIIIPVFKESETINDIIAYLKSVFQNDTYEIIVVDGNKADTLATIKDDSVIKMVSEKSRGIQMNEGEKAAKGNILLFLHADTKLPATASNDVKTILKTYHIGAFKLHLDSSSILIRFVSWTANLRTRFKNMPYGDQAFFIEKSFFDEIGGFKNIPIMEDIDIINRIKKRGEKIGIAKTSVSTSARRWVKKGVLRVFMKNRMLIFLYKCGVSPNKLARWY